MIPANAVTKYISGLSREISALAARISSPTDASGRISVALLYSDLLIAMKRLADRPLPATSPTRKNTRSASSRKKS